MCKDYIEHPSHKSPYSTPAMTMFACVWIWTGVALCWKGVALFEIYPGEFEKNLGLLH